MLCLRVQILFQAAIAFSIYLYILCIFFYFQHSPVIYEETWDQQQTCIFHLYYLLMPPTYEANIWRFQMHSQEQVKIQ